MSDPSLSDEYSHLAEKEKERNVQRKRWKTIDSVSLISSYFILFWSAWAIRDSDVNVIISNYFSNPINPISGTILAILLLIISIIYNRKNKKGNFNVSLDLDDVIFLRLYETMQNIDKYYRERKNDDKQHYKNQALKTLYEAEVLIYKWDYGNTSLSRTILNERYKKLTYNLTTKLKYNIKNNLENHNIYELLNEVCRYLISPSIVKIDKINDSFDKLKDDNKQDTTNIDKIWIFINENPISSRIIISLLLYVILVLVTSLFYTLSFWELLLGFFTVFVFIDRICGYNPIVKKPKEIIEENIKKNSIKKEKIKSEITFDFENMQTGLPPVSPWITQADGNSKSYITDEIGGALSTSKSLKLEGFKDSNTYVEYNFEKEMQKINLQYYIYVKMNTENLLMGVPFIVQSKNITPEPQIDTRTVYMDIIRGKLRHGISKNNKTICDIDPEKWYKINVDVDCIEKKYVIEVNGVKSEGKIFEKHDSVSKIRTKHYTGNQNFITYIDEISIKFLE